MVDYEEKKKRGAPKMETVVIDRVTDLEALTTENQILATTISNLAQEYAANSSIIDAAESRKKEIMATIKPLLESQKISTVRSPDWTISRVKGREGKQTFKADKAAELLSAENVINALCKPIPIECINLSTLISLSGAKLEDIEPFIDKAKDGQPYYGLRRASDKDQINISNK